MTNSDFKEWFEQKLGVTTIKQFHQVYCKNKEECKLNPYSEDCCKEILKQINENPFFTATMEFKVTTIEDGMTALLKVKPENEEYHDWETLPNEVEKLEIYNGSKTYLILYFKKEKIELMEDEILNADKFRKKFFSKIGFMLPPIKNNVWAEFLNRVKMEKGKVMLEKMEDISDEEELADDIIDYVSKCKPVKNKEYAFRNGYCYLDSMQRVLIPNKIIKRLIEKSTTKKISLRELSFLLKDYLAKGTIPLDVGKSKKRFWVFKNDFGIVPEDCVEFEEEGEKNGKTV